MTEKNDDLQIQFMDLFCGGETVEAIRERRKEHFSIPSPISSPDAFTRLNETDDKIFYTQDRFVSHLDSLALSTVGGGVGKGK